MPPKVRAHFMNNAMSNNDGVIGGVQAKKSNQAMFEGALANGALRLANRGLTALPPQMFELDQIQYANKQWWMETELTILDISHNEILAIDFPRGFHHAEQQDQPNVFSSLKSLIAAHNRIAHFPAEVLAHLGNVTKLDLSFNQLQQLPTRMGDALPLLVELDLSGNRLEEFSGFWMCSHLSVLKLAQNNLTKFGGETFAGGGYPQLQILNLSSNQLDFLDGGAERNGGAFASPALKELDLSKNRLSSLAGLVPPNLTTLNARGNKIDHLGPETLCSASLKDVQLGSNRLSDLPKNTFYIAREISVLDLSSNAIPDVSAVCSLTQLRRLDLQNNCLSTLPAKLCFLKGLTGLVLEGNPLRGLRREIVQKGTVEILNYLKTRLTDAEVTEYEHLGRNVGGHSSTGITHIPQQDLRQQDHQSQHRPMSTQRTNRQQIPEPQYQEEKQYREADRFQTSSQQAYGARFGRDNQQSGGSTRQNNNTLHYQDRPEVEETRRIARGRGSRANANSVNLFGAPESDEDAFKSEVGGVKLAHAGNRAGATWDLSRAVQARVHPGRITTVAKVSGTNSGAPELPPVIEGNLNFSELHNYEEAIAIKTVKLDGQSAVHTVAGDFLARLPSLVEISLNNTSMGSVPVSSGGLLLDNQTPESLARISLNKCAYQGDFPLLIHPTSPTRCYITRVSLAGNNITNLSRQAIAPLANTLQYLDLNENRLAVFPVDSLTLCHELIELQLSRNALVEFDLSRHEAQTGQTPHDIWPKLSLLDLSYNNLGTLPLTLCTMETHLRSLKVEGLPMKWLRRSVIEKGTLAILEYLKSRIPGQQ